LAALAAVALSAAPVMAAAEGEAAGSDWTLLINKIVNVAVLFGVLAYYLRSPIAAYLRDRGTAIRKDLADAAAVRASAESQLASVRTRVAGLPAELALLRRRGEEEVAGEQRRMKDAADEERRHLLDRARRDIDIQLRVARKQLLEQAASLAVSLTRDRVQREITPDDQARLIDRYASEVHP
jgi:F0F1-type ATP synthase membrane subunit b/b'